jgi:hypothetical protein
MPEINISCLEDGKINNFVMVPECIKMHSLKYFPRFTWVSFLRVGHGQVSNP